MRIGIDAHCIGQHKTGNETYTLNLLRFLSLLEDDGNEYVAYLTRGGETKASLFLNGHITSRLIYPNSPYFRIPLGFSVESRLRRLDLFHAQYFLPFNLRCRTVLTVHDIIYEKFPEFYKWTDLLRNRLGIPSSCRRADHIITVSECSKRDLVEIYGLPPDRISVTPLGPPESFRPMDRGVSQERLRSRYGIEGSFLLYVGSLQPRKNLSRLLAAFAQVRKRARIPHKLVVVGPKDRRCADILGASTDSSLQGHTVVAGYVPDEDLPAFYNAACAFVYPSMYEGFGLPVIEAMACGTPTVTSRGSALEEVAGDAAVLVDPCDVSSIADAIERVVADPELQQALNKRGRAHSQKFSFRNMAEQTRQVYQQLLS